MKRFNLITAVVSALALAACGEGRILLNKIQGKQDRHSDPAFKADATLLSGYYEIYSDDSKKLETFEVWLFESGNVTIYRGELGDKNCMESRPFSVEGANVLTVAAQGTCPSQTYRVQSQSRSRMDLVKDGSTKVAKLFSQTPAELTETMFLWDVQASDVPPKLRSILPVEPNAASILAAQDSFRKGLLGASLTVKGPLERRFTLEGEALDAVHLTKRSDNSPLSCWLEFGPQSGDVLKGFQGSVATVSLSSPLRLQGHWLLQGLATAAPTETVENNAGRNNNLVLTFVDDSALILDCSKSKSAGPITFSELEQTLTGIASFSRSTNP